MVHNTPGQNAQRGWWQRSAGGHHWSVSLSLVVGLHQYSAGMPGYCSIYRHITTATPWRGEGQCVPECGGPEGLPVDPRDWHEACIAEQPVHTVVPAVVMSPDVRLGSGDHHIHTYIHKYIQVYTYLLFSSAAAALTEATELTSTCNRSTFEPGWSASSVLRAVSAFCMFLHARHSLTSPPSPPCTPSASSR